LQLERNPTSHRTFRGWILDLYPSLPGQMCLWIISENGKRIRLIDEFYYKVFVSGKEDELDRLLSQFSSDRSIKSYRFVYRYDNPSRAKSSKVLEFTLNRPRASHSFVHRVLQSGRYLRYQVH
jgi:hypothetical protein